MIKISAIVVGYNEAHLLKNCLTSLLFCDEVVYIDLGSKDESVLIASKLGVKVMHFSLHPIVEYIQRRHIPLLKNDWIIFLDPDEVLDKTLVNELINKLNSNLAYDIGAFLVPWRFYFKDMQLKGTIWGGHNYKYLLINRNKFEFLPISHSGRRLINGFKSQLIDFNSHGSNVIHHFWMTSYRGFIKKHVLYLKNEGKDRYNNGMHISFLNLIKTPIMSFYISFINKKGYLDGLLGFLLSIFWSFYETISNLTLFYFQILRYLNLIDRKDVS